MNGPLVTIRRHCTLPSWPQEYTGCDVRKLPKPEVTLMDREDQDHLMISRWIGKCLLIIFANELKVVLIQKVLMPLSQNRQTKLCSWTLILILCYYVGSNYVSYSEGSNNKMESYTMRKNLPKTLGQLIFW